MGAVKIISTGGKGLRELERRVTEGARRVMVGVPLGTTEPDGTPTALVAAVHEFGSESRGIPERSFLRAGIRANKDKFLALNRNSLKMIAEGRMTIDVGLGRLGAFAVGAIQQQITNGDYVALKPATIRRKGSSKPLIDTGHLRQSITWVIEGKGVAA